MNKCFWYFERYITERIDCWHSSLWVEKKSNDIIILLKVYKFACVVCGWKTRLVKGCFNGQWSFANQVINSFFCL